MHFLQRWVGYSNMPVTQSPLSWDVNINKVRSPADFKMFLKSKNILFNEGGHTIYIPPQPGLDLIFPEMVRFYPKDSGYKVLKHFENREKANYIGSTKHWIISYSERIMTGSLMDLIDSANVLHFLGVGPSLYDLTEIHSSEVTMVCFVVQHVSGRPPTLEGFSIFLHRLKSSIDQRIIALVPPEGLEYADFQPPDCRKNLLQSNDSNKLFYIDFQQFIVRNKKKLIKEILSESKGEFSRERSQLSKEEENAEIYPISKEGIRKRWIAIKNILQEAGVSVSHRVVLDIGCQTGGILSCALAEGALWGLGWDTSQRVEEAKRLNTVLGNTRLDFHEVKLSKSYPISEDIPERFRPLLNESVVFYLEGRSDPGFLSELKNLSWKALVFEGHAGEIGNNGSDILEKMQEDWNCRIAATSEIRDDKHRKKTCMVLLRE